MMAFDRPPSHPGLAPQTVDALKQRLARSVADGVHGNELHAVLCAAAAEARAKGIQAEQLLIALKDIWYSLPEVLNASSPEVEAQLLRDMVSRCIQEYYAI